MFLYRGQQLNRNNNNNSNKITTTAIAVAAAANIDSEKCSANRVSAY